MSVTPSVAASVQHDPHVPHYHHRLKFAYSSETYSSGLPMDINAALDTLKYEQAYITADCEDHATYICVIDHENEKVKLYQISDGAEASGSITTDVYVQVIAE